MSDIIPINTFIGLANKLDPLKHTPGALKSALNVDVDDSNNIRRRAGYVLDTSYTNITDSYSTKDRQNAYIIDDGDLVNVNTNIIIGSDFGSDLLWDDHNGSVFIHGDKTGLIENNKFIDLNHPQCPQAKVKRVNGSQPEGYYQVACSYIDSNGREGGMTSPIVILVDDNSALEIIVEQIEGYEVIIYISPVNGKYVYKWQKTNADSVVWDGPQYLLASRTNDSQFGALTIPSTNIKAIAYHQTKLYICEYIPEDGKSIIWFSKSFSYHLYYKSHDYIVINDKVTCLIDIGDSLVIGTEKSIFYYNGQLQQVANYGIPIGHPYAIDENGNHFIWTHNGICKLNQFENLTNKIHELPSSPSVFSAIIEQNGYGRFVNLLGDKTDAENIFRS